MQIGLVVQVPFECPHCTRDYSIEIDLVKLTRLNRVAVCGNCTNRFSVSIRFSETTDEDDELEQPSTFPPPASEAPPPSSEAPPPTSEAPPAPSEAPPLSEAPPPTSEAPPPTSEAPPPQSTPAPTLNRRERPTLPASNRSRHASSGRGSERRARRGASQRMNTKSDGLQIPKDILKQMRRTAPRVQSRDPDAEDQKAPIEAKTDPSMPAFNEEDARAFNEELRAQRSRATTPQDRAARSRNQTRPTLRRPGTPAPRPSEPPSAPISNRPPSSAPGHATMDGIPSPPKRKKNRVRTSIIVEVGDASKNADKTKTRKAVYSPQHLATQPGLGVPKHVLDKHRKKKKR